MLRDHYSNVNIQHVNTTSTEICAPVQSLYDYSDIPMEKFHGLQYLFSAAAF